MRDCERTEAMVRGATVVDDAHIRSCPECRDARSVNAYLNRLAAADDVSPSLPNPQILLLKAELFRDQNALRAEGDTTRWMGVGVWTLIAVTWLVVLTWKLGDIQSLLARFDIVSAIPGGALTAALLVAALGGLVAFTVFAVAVHSVLAEL